MNYLFKNEVINYEFSFQPNKKTIIFLHGWGGNKFSFAKTMQLLKCDYNILTVTLPTIQETTSIWNLFDYVSLIDNILLTHSIKSVIVICHSFGFRVAMLLNKRVKIEKIVVTGGAGLKKEGIFLKIIKNNNKIALNFSFLKNFYKFIASKDYHSLSQTNRETFKNIVNLNLEFASKFNVAMLLFWGKNDMDTKVWIANKLGRKNKAKKVVVDSHHFAYLNENNQFNHEVVKFLNN